ncbi:hypothetical protein FB567DRAFT_614323 [Paraphoma chrysanthemicola]|uniref:F-box domain-containing protein n=1 Tax=Paraphoma chrysanthemicola TaxID=798071 RepID=A0A8K0REL3_9PLEO|nr:hypothetical protein FB567DRAFT_614323 [Paraphoma chrysanthemicola]
MPTALAHSSTSSTMMTSQMASATPMYNSCSTTLGSFLSSTYAPIQKVLISYLEPAEFVALSSVCRQVRTGLEDGLRSTCYNIDARLSKFFTNTKEFRRVQAITGALIDEEFALAFFMNKSTPNQLLLRFEWVFEQGNSSILSMVDFLVSDGWNAQQYLQKYPREQWDKFWKNHASGVRLFIDIDGYSSPLCTLLKHAPTTATLTFISWNAAYALFPRSALIDKDAHILQDLQTRSPDGAQHEAIRKLAKYGLKPKGLHLNHEARGT